MPLPAPSEREELHCRVIEMKGFRRSDGALEVEAHLKDTRTHEFTVENGRSVSAGQPLHDMSVRLVVDADMNVIDIFADIDASPFNVCTEATAAMQAIKGLRIGPGWTAKVRECLAGACGCTHLRELLGPMATVAIQSTYKERQARPDAVDSEGRPRKINSCYAYSSNGELVLKRWPQFYEGPSRSDQDDPD
jgi:hypothetical protein